MSINYAKQRKKVRILKDQFKYNMSYSEMTDRTNTLFFIIFLKKGVNGEKQSLSNLDYSG